MGASLLALAKSIYYMQNVITWVKGKVFFVLTLLV